jgi:chitin synthase
MQEDIDAAFKATVSRALTKLDSKEVPEKPTLDDSNRTFRTRLVAVWMLTNGALALAVQDMGGWLNVDDPNTTEDSIKAYEARYSTMRNNYFTFILYATFGLAFVRFVGCLHYWFRRNLCRCFRKT